MADAGIGIFFQCQQSQSLGTQPPFSPISLGVKRKTADNEITYSFFNGRNTILSILRIP